MENSMKMKKIKVFIFMILFFATGFYAFIKISKFIAIDKCLDNGGSWNYEIETCECSKKKN
jgi:hypothetical protein